MPAPENSASVVLATCHALARDCLKAYRDTPVPKDKGAAELFAATIEALAAAIPYLALAVSRSVGCEAPKQPAPPTNANTEAVGTADVSVDRVPRTS